MPLITTAMITSHIETDLSDSALRRLARDAESEIDKRYGELQSQVDQTEEASLSRKLFLSRKADQITTVTEEIRSGGGYETTVLSSNDYVVRQNGRAIERLADGDNPRATWGDVVTVIYQPVDETENRVRVAIDLVRLAIRYNALGLEEIGDWRGDSLEYEKEREALLTRLSRWTFS